MQQTTGESTAYYASCAEGLGALTSAQIGSVRFTPDADARWKAFRGELHDGDRLRILIADAAMSSPVGFSAREVFGIEGLTSDEAFGATWQHLKESQAQPLIRHAAKQAQNSPNLTATLAEICNVWGLKPSVPNTGIPKITPASRVAIAGSGTVMAFAKAMHGRDDMDFADQLTLITNHPGERQLFGIAAALLQSPATLKVFTVAKALLDGDKSKALSGFTGSITDTTIETAVKDAVHTIARW